MYKPLSKPNTRVDVADVLRAVAIIGIILIHFLEHLDFIYYPAEPEGSLGAISQGVNDVIFFLGAGKMYAIFALLFGFSLFVQHDNQAQKGVDFRPRFAWRMLLLICFALFDKLFYIGDILLVYAVLGLVVLPLIRLSDKVLLALFIVLVIQPVELGSIVIGAINPEVSRINLGSGMVYSHLIPAQAEGSFWDVVKISLGEGMFQGFRWALENGRCTQNLALFIAGILIGRKRLFYNEGENLKFWKAVLLISFGAAAIVFVAQNYVPSGRGLFYSGIENLLAMWRNLAMMSFYVSGIILLYYKTKAQKGLQKLAPYGRMTLTHYIGQSIIGTFLFYGWGLALYSSCNHLVSVLIAVVLIIAQWVFSTIWSKHHKRGPLEQLWNTLTWLPK